MMMAGGLLIMLVIGLILIGVPVLIAAMMAGGGLTTLLKPRTQPAEPENFPSFYEPAGERKCPACGRTVRPDWNVCPSCGEALT